MMTNKYFLKWLFENCRIEWGGIVNDWSIGIGERGEFEEAARQSLWIDPKNTQLRRGIPVLAIDQNKEHIIAYRDAHTGEWVADDVANREPHRVNISKWMPLPKAF